MKAILVGKYMDDGYTPATEKNPNPEYYINCYSEGVVYRVKGFPKNLNVFEQFEDIQVPVKITSFERSLYCKYSPVDQPEAV